MLLQRVASRTANGILEPREFTLEPVELAVRGCRGREPRGRLT